MTGEKKRLFRSIQWTYLVIDLKCHLGFCKILLSVSLALSGGRREAVEAGSNVLGGYKRRGGDGDGGGELGKGGGTDVLAAYLKALSKGG